jgi:hypothetical protein
MKLHQLATKLSSKPRLQATEQVRAMTPRSSTVVPQTITREMTTTETAEETDGVEMATTATGSVTLSKSSWELFSVVEIMAMIINAAATGMGSTWEIFSVAEETATVTELEAEAMTMVATSETYSVLGGMGMVTAMVTAMVTGLEAAAMAMVSEPCLGTVNVGGKGV